MKVHRRSAAALVLSSGVAFSGCSSPLTGQHIEDRLSRQGVPRPEAARAPADAARSPDPDLPPTGITLADLLHRAERLNPDLRASRSGVGVAAGRTWQASLYPNPTASITSGEIGLEGGSANTIVGITQPIVVGDRLRAAVATAEADEAARLAAVEQVRREVFGRVAEAHARILELHAQLQLIDELIQLAEATLAIAETRFQARAVAEPDVIRPRVEVHHLRADRHRIARELASAEKQLGLLLNSGPIAAPRLAATIPLTPDPMDEAALVALIDAAHPALIVADRRIAAAEADLRRIRAERVPNLSLTAGIGYSAEGDQGIAELGVAAELPVWNRRQGDLLSARFELADRRQQREAMRMRLLSDLTEAVGSYHAARDQLAVFGDKVVPDAQRAFDQIDESYRAGRASFLDLLDAQRTLTQARRTQIELAGHAAVARARIAAITGLDLDSSPGDLPGAALSSNPQTPREGAKEHP